MLSTNVTLIAEAGINHNGSLDRAQQMIAVAANAGADYVKFQAFHTEELVQQQAPLAAYQASNCPDSDSQFNLLKPCELSHNDFKTLCACCAEHGIGFLATPFDMASLHFLDSLGVGLIKVSSGDLTNAPLLFEMARLQKQVIISSGMATLQEVLNALAVLQLGYTQGTAAPPDYQTIQAHAQSLEVALLQDKVAVLHCTSNYPAAASSLNLRAIDTLRQATQLSVGYSDHSSGIHIPVAAVALGARIIEKHFTLDQKLPGPDHIASIEGPALQQMIADIREVEAALGNGTKSPHPCELNTMAIARKGLYAKKPIRKGEIIAADAIHVLRPEAPASPMQFWDKAGSIAMQDYAIGEPL